MSHCRASLLADRAVLRVSGGEAAKFLQGLITNDIGKANAGRAIHAGLLSPQGKLLFDFFVVGAGDGYLVDVAKDQASNLAKRLGFYKLRADVEIAEQSSLAVAAAWNGTPELPEGAVAFPDPRLAELGQRIIFASGGGPAALGCESASEQAYHAHRIALGVPEGGRDYAYGDTYPHEALFDQLSGVDFTKGCFVGQEVVSRMEHRGTARKRIVQVEAEETSLPPSGTEITAAGVPVGTLGSSDGRLGLALVRLDRAEAALAAGQPLMAADVKVRLRTQPWARFRLDAAKTPA